MGRGSFSVFSRASIRSALPTNSKLRGLTSIEASVPGEAALDLSRKGELPTELFFPENLKKLKPYELYEWWYQREFPTPAGIEGRRPEHRFHAVDCIATCWLSRNKPGKTADATEEQSFDVTGQLNDSGPNLLAVRRSSLSVDAASKRCDPAYTITAGKTNQEAIWVRRPAHT